MEPRTAKVIATVLGVPGFALLVFYSLMKQFKFSFAQISAPLAGAIVIVFIAVVGLITILALRWWAPRNQQATEAAPTAIAPIKADIAKGSRVVITNVKPSTLDLPDGVFKMAA